MLPRDLSPASFRGVRFLVPQDSAEEGRNAIRHATPDSSFHYIEDNGRHPPEFKISALLHGDNLPAKFASLRSALTRPGPGLLKHPYYGRQLCMVDGKFRVKRDDREAGVIEIEIPFSVTGPAALPGIVTGGVAAYVTGIATSALTSLFQQFADLYPAPNSPESARVLAAAVGDIGASLDASFRSAGTAGADLARDSARLARDPAALADAIHAAVRAPLDDDTYAAPDLVTGYISLAGLAESIAAEAASVAVTTSDRAARQSALDTLAAHLDAAAFLAMADAMAGRDYTTADEVTRDEDRLAGRIDSIQGRTLDAATHDAVLSVYTAASEVMQAAAVRLPRLVTMRVNNLPLSVLAYHLYESDARVPTLVDLNLAANPILVAGSTSVLME